MFFISATESAEIVGNSASMPSHDLIFGEASGVAQKELDLGRITRPFFWKLTRVDLIQSGGVGR